MRAFIVLILSVFFAQAAWGKAPRDISCNAITKTADGSFTYGSSPGLSILKSVGEPGPFVIESKPGVVAFACARTRLIPVVEDVKVLQAGYSLHVGAMDGGALEFVELELKNGKVEADASRAQLSTAEQEALTKVVGKMQRVVDQAATPKP